MHEAVQLVFGTAHRRTHRRRHGQHPIFLLFPGVHDLVRRTRAHECGCRARAAGRTELPILAW